MAKVQKANSLKNDEFYMVGIGSSAGGIEALSLLVKHLPEDLNCCYVIAQHLSPNYKSILHEILNRESKLLVKKVSDGEKPKKNTVYVIPPNKNLVVKSKTLILQEPSKEIFTKPSINILFESISQEYGENGIGIILSGTGTDGTQGLISIKAGGGITFAQIPKTAKYDGMPTSAIDSGSVDYEIAPEQFGDIIKRYLMFDDNIASMLQSDSPSDELEILLKKVKKKTEIDFTNYKHATLLRRLQRRMTTVECSTLGAYLEYVTKHEEELVSFAKDTLISVTSFFRDTEAFNIFSSYIKELVANKKNGDEVRVWIAGCATGEEAYSIGILFLEYLEEQGKMCKLQIFATDIDINALSIARAGVYSENAVSEVKSEYIEKYFKRTDHGYEVNKFLRDSIVFAKQDLTYDPPFLKLDLITCRNVLIYFNNELQAKVIGMFHYALHGDGYLFLGRSESIGVNSDIFIPLDTKTRVFKKDPKMLLNTKKKISRGYLRSSTENISGQRKWEKILQDEIASYYENAAVLVDIDLNIIHTFGQIGKFISFPKGSPRYNLQELILELFKPELVPLFNVVKKYQEARKGKEKRVDGMLFRLVIKPTKEKANETYVVLFENVVEEELIGEQDKEEQQLNSLGRMYDYSPEEQLVTQEHLQSLIEELSTSNEEMQALNEEIQASNEEMQATNEELEASNEELQATNEELASVNEELLVKTNELATTNFDFESVYNTLNFPLIVLDTELHLKRFNTTAARMYELQYSAVGQHIESSYLPYYIKDLEEKFLDAINKKRKDSLFVTHEKNTYKVFINPSLNKSGKVLSIVLAIVDNTDIIQAKKQLEEKQEMMLSIMNNSRDMIALKDIAGRYEFVNRRFEEFFGLSSHEVMKKSDAQLFSAEIAKTFRMEDMSVLKDLSAKESVQPCLLDGKLFYLHSNRFPIFDEEGIIKSICVEIQDVSHKYEAEQKLKLAAKVFERAGEGILITDENNKILTVNDAFTRITGYSAEEALGQDPAMLNSGKHEPEFFKNLWTTLMERGWWQGEIYNKNKTGEIYPEWLTINTVKDVSEKITNFVAIFSDISHIKSSQRQIEHMATHDELTALPNRFCFVDELKHQIASSNKKGEKLAVLFIDLDEFKNINDTLGHNIGDHMLIEVARRLRECTKPGDFIARLGGDEFTAILHTNNIEEIMMYAQKVLDYLTASYTIDEKKLYVSCSIGISIYPDHGHDSSALLRSADTAMYKAKEGGKKRFVFFEEEMKALSMQRMSIESGLRTALEKDLFEIVFQPKVDMKSKEILGAEVLLRWNDPTLGKVSPSVFIPIAEKSGLMSDIGKKVIDKTFIAIKELTDGGLEIPSIAMNISAVQFRDTRFETCFLDKLELYNIPKDKIIVEITESVLMDNTADVKNILENFHAQGIRISIDDFGTGYSSLSYLKKYPLSELKIDRSFIDDIESSSDDYHITHAIIDIADALGLDVIAEGVENEEQRGILSALGCHKAQGYFFYHPLSFKDFKKLLKKVKLNEK